MQSYQEQTTWDRGPSTSRLARDLVGPDADGLLRFAEDPQIPQPDGIIRLPVLLRQYLKLDATLLCFNLDPSFASVVDGLAFLDLTRTSAPMIKRVMGSEGYRQFCHFHGLPSEVLPQFRKTG